MALSEIPVLQEKPSEVRCVDMELVELMFVLGANFPDDIYQCLVCGDRAKGGKYQIYMIGINSTMCRPKWVGVLQTA